MQVKKIEEILDRLHRRSGGDLVEGLGLGLEHFRLPGKLEQANDQGQEAHDDQRQDELGE